VIIVRSPSFSQPPPGITKDDNKRSISPSNAGAGTYGQNEANSTDKQSLLRSSIDRENWSTVFCANDKKAVNSNTSKYHRFTNNSPSSSFPSGSTQRNESPSSSSADLRYFQSPVTSSLSPHYKSNTHHRK
jgi:hypothetical protein